MWLYPRHLIHCKKRIELTPVSRLLPGEKVGLTLTQNIVSKNGISSLWGGFHLDFYMPVYFSNGNFIPQTPMISTGERPLDIEFADLNGDQFVDMVVANSGDRTISIFLNDKNDGFEPPINLITDNNPQDIVLEDIDFDGDIDIVVVHNLARSLIVLSNQGNGVFEQYKYKNFSDYIKKVCIADLHNDRTPDALLIDNSTNLLHVVDLQSDDEKIYNVGRRPVDITVSDINNDGHQDVLVLDKEIRSIIVLMDRVIDYKKIYIDLNEINNPSRIKTADLNNDSYEDLVVLSDSSLTILWNQQDEQFSTRTYIHHGKFLADYFFGDFDGDLDLDIAVTDYSNKMVYLFRNQLNNSFEVSDTISTVNNPLRINGFVKDDKGIIDLVISNPDDRSIQILRNHFSDSLAIKLTSDYLEEFTGDVLIYYTIYSLDSTPVNLTCMYSTDHGITWTKATVSGDTTSILPDNQPGQLTWHSLADLPGMDHSNVIFKIIPVGQKEGKADSLILHVDNNKLPVADLLENKVEISDTAEIRVIITDDETDSVRFSLWYRFDKMNEWQKATMLNDSVIRATGDTISVIWNTRNDIPDYSGYVWLKCSVSDNDSGLSDSIFVLVDNLGVPVVNSIMGPVNEVKEDIIISYDIYDDEQDPLTLHCQYSTDSISWYPATVTGKTNGISPAEYSGQIVWNSGSDLPGKDDKSVWFRIIPEDSHMGIGKSTNAFHVDNNSVPSVMLDSLGLYQSGLIRIPFLIQDAEDDTITIQMHYKVGTSDWALVEANNAVYLPENYRDTLNWNSLDALGFGKFQDVWLKVTPIDHDTGTTIMLSPFQVFNFAGDYTGDIKIDFDDLVDFASAWREQDITKEIGPAIGEPPLLIPQPDGKIDFEDLMSFVRQWYWSFEHPDYTGQKVFRKILMNGKNKSADCTSQEKIPLRREGNKFLLEYKVNQNVNSIIPYAKYSDKLKIEQTGFQAWNREAGNTISVRLDSMQRVFGMYLEIQYNSENINKINARTFMSDGIQLIGTNAAEGIWRLNYVFLANSEKQIPYLDSLLVLQFESKRNEEQEIKVIWKIYDENKNIITSGFKKLRMALYSSIPKEYALYQNFPNPFNPVTTIRYQLPVEGHVQLIIHNLLGQKIETLVDQVQPAGYYEIQWGTGEKQRLLPSGLYFMTLHVKGKNGSRYLKTRKMLFIK
jgi:hypothetical protein